MDVANDGRIALMGQVNERLIIFNPDQESYTPFPLPFTYAFQGGVALNKNGRLMVCDFQDVVPFTSLPRARPTPGKPRGANGPGNFPSRTWKARIRTWPITST